MRLTISLTDLELKILKKRAQDNMLSIREMIEDIVRRSCVSSMKKQGMKKIKIDDNLVGIFSREKWKLRKKAKNKK
jgi:hypothetical protein